MGQYKAFELGTDAEDTNFYTFAANDGVGFDETLEWCASKIVVSTENGEFCLFKDPYHIFHTEVELMIADGGGIASHSIHQFYFDVTFE